jgi:hypothetical protein
MQSIAEQGLEYPDMSPLDKVKLHMCDWLDAYLFVMRTNAHILNQRAWREQLADAYDTALVLGCSAKLIDLIESAEGYYLDRV